MYRMRPRLHHTRKPDSSLEGNAVDLRENGSPSLVGKGIKPSGISGKTEVSSEIQASCSPSPNLPHYS
jgi:hypothetical protein